jgi:hypothetical protein
LQPDDLQIFLLGSFGRREREGAWIRCLGRTIGFRRSGGQWTDQSDESDDEESHKSLSVPGINNRISEKKNSLTLYARLRGE